MVPAWVMVCSLVLLLTAYLVSSGVGPQELLPLKVSEDGRSLVTADGRPFFWLADTAWWIRRIPPEDVEMYMARRARQGFNVIQVHPGSDPGFEETDYAGNRPFLADDPTRPNEAFWQNTDSIVARARELGLYVALVPMWGQEYGRYFAGDPERARQFGEWIGRRYAGESHVLWIVSGEYDAINRCVLPISPEQKALFQGAGQGLTSARPGRQLVTVHPGVARTSSADFHNEPWLGFNMLQSGHTVDCEAYGLTENHALIAHDFALSPPKPVLDGEPIYEDTPDGVWIRRDFAGPRADAAAVRRKAYWAVCSGACGHTYGHLDVFCFYEPDSPGEVRRLSEGGAGQRGNWRDALDAEGATQMRHVRTLAQCRPMVGRAPDPSFVVAGQGTGLDCVAAARGAGASYALVYIPRGRPVTVALSRISGVKVQAWWFDPRSGAAAPAGAHAGSRSQEFTPPTGGDGQDWVLVLDDASAGYPPPGR
ncbi:MAG: glycoside hydrolase family 140 protein [Lentisphaeria bacterium]|nr:glycoside hydrolase family 140 protein [Lentisphaeria bacterium]